jgi:hypothetical protein
MFRAYLLNVIRKPVPLFFMTPLEWHELGTPESSDKGASRNILTISFPLSFRHGQQTSGPRHNIIRTLDPVITCMTHDA